MKKMARMSQCALLTMLLMALVLGCADTLAELEVEASGGSEELASDGKFDVLRPTSQELMGYLNVVLPESELAVPDVLGTWLGHTVSDPGLRLPAGSGCFEVEPSFANPAGAMRVPRMQSRVCGIDVRPGETTDLQLGGVRLVVMPEWAASFDSLSAVGHSLERIVTQAEELNLWTRGGSLDPNVAELVLPVAPGHYVFSTETVGGAPIAAFEADVLAGEVVEVPIPPLDLRAHLRIVPPEQVFPDPPQADECVAPVVHMRSGYSRRTVDISDGPAELDYLPIRDRNRYALEVHSTALPLALAPGDALEVRLARLDVDDVLVEREDGSTYRASGQYTVYRLEGHRHILVTLPALGGSHGDCRQHGDQHQFPTETGLDLLPGDYRVEVRYETEVGRQLDVYEITLD